MIKSRRLRLAGHVAKMEGDRTAFKMLIDTPTGKRPLRRPRRRWESTSLTPPVCLQALAAQFYHHKRLCG